MKKIKIIQIRSRIGCNHKHKAILNSLGLKKIGSIVEHNDIPSIRGMIDKIQYLIKIDK